MKQLTIILIAFLLFPCFAISENKQKKPMEHKSYYCEYCGHKFPTVLSLTSASCPCHPDGPNKGPHKLYQGTEKSRYTCKYCGHTFPTIMSMVGATCPRHPNGPNKGYHSPAL
jgi:DNA-directed RNA polymerase subunit RPC12/RpoP